MCTLHIIQSGILQCFVFGTYRELQPAASSNNRRMRWWEVGSLFIVYFVFSFVAVWKVHYYTADSRQFIVFRLSNGEKPVFWVGAKSSFLRNRHSSSAVQFKPDFNMHSLLLMYCAQRALLGIWKATSIVFFYACLTPVGACVAVATIYELRELIERALDCTAHKQ